MRVMGGVAAAFGVGLWLLVLAGFLLSDYYRLRPFLHHPVIFGVVGSMALAVALGLVIRNQVLKWLAVVLVVLAGLGWGGIVLFALLVAGGHESEVERLPSPNGDMELAVFVGGGFTIDPIATVRVYTNNGLLSRENYLGCFNGDRDGLKEVEWTGPRTVRVELSRGGTTTIALDDRGRPDQTISC
ncbi:hypothetical protein [Mycobacterium sp. GA-1841]|uniref:hypothetical protein n=1 Tax=Mycobacterium sp. GA-1841 TaxID=1834154 RepID=UPI0011156E15|nr:hypothetical protein [Mycobacterium sp. GA-1841]